MNNLVPTFFAIILLVALSFIILATSLVSCESNMGKLESIFNPYSNLYEITDEKVESLATTYDHYGLFDALMEEKYTEDKMYKVLPMGRLINVRIEDYVSPDKYEALKKRLQKHYKNNPNVKDVYICEAGTVVIDCRN